MYHKIFMFVKYSLVLLSIGLYACQKENPQLQTATFNYDFNNGQLVSSYNYTGSHAKTLSAVLKVEELADGTSKITVELTNTMNGKTYMTHTHDATSDPNVNNGLPYVGMPNSTVFVQPIEATGTTASASQVTSKSFNEIVSTYDGFFVVHDPLQPVSTTDPNSYIILGKFARS